MTKLSLYAGIPQEACSDVGSPSVELVEEEVSTTALEKTAMASMTWTNTLSELSLWKLQFTEWEKQFL